jgi:hypothetical protein
MVLIYRDLTYLIINFEGIFKKKSKTLGGVEL